MRTAGGDAYEGNCRARRRGGIVAFVFCLSRRTRYIASLHGVDLLNAERAGARPLQG